MDKEKVKKSIDLIQRFSPEMFGHPDGYYLAFSGGKDSIVVKRLMEMSGVKFDAHYRVTSVDPPELIQYIKERHGDVSIDKPLYAEKVYEKDENGNAVEVRKPILNEKGRPQQITMWNLIPRKLMPPTRLVRYCCEYLKEDGGDGRLTVTGVRWAESVNRQKNQGVVTIAGKKAGRELGENENFQSTMRGGWCS